MERDQAARTLEMIDAARGWVERRSLSNGVIPLVWGAFVLLTLPLFDFLPSPVAVVLFTAAAAMLSLWTARYAQRLPVQSLHAGRVAYVALFVGWGMYYAVVLLGGALLLGDRLTYPLTLITPLAAAPLLLTGWRQFGRGR